MLVDELRKRWRAAPRRPAFRSAIQLTPEGLVLGADTLLASSNPSLNSGYGPAGLDEARLLALLAVAYDQMIDKASLGHLAHALKRQAEGDHARAELHLALSGLRPLSRPDAAAERLFVADGLLKAGVDPARIPRALGLAIEGLEAALKRYNSNQPRLPAGESGGGQWASAGETDAAQASAVAADRSTHGAHSKPVVKPPRPRLTSVTNNPAGPARSGRLGALSMFYESGYHPGKEILAAGKVSTGKGDPGGASYGAFQMASRRGVVQDFLASRFGAQWAHLFQGQDPTARDGDFSKTWKQIAKDNGQVFFDAQHAYIKKTEYDPAVRKILKRTDININAQSDAVQNVIWSMAVQHGAGGAASKACKAIKALPAGLKMTDPTDQQALIHALYQVRRSTLAHNQNTKNLLSRYAREQKDAQRMLSHEEFDHE